MYLLTYGVGGRRLKIAHMAAPSHGQYLSHWLYAAILNTYKVMKLKVDYAPKKKQPKCNTFASWEPHAGQPPQTITILQT